MTNLNPNCTKCGGRGHYKTHKDELGRRVFKRCELCHPTTASLANLGRLENAPTLLQDTTESNPILKFLSSNLVIRDTNYSDQYSMFDVLLKNAVLKTPDWVYGEVTDRELVDAWLGKSDLLEGMGITRERQSSTDLVRKPPLLILRLGFITYKHNGLSEQVSDALLFRKMYNKPTWVVLGISDDFDQTHPCWSPKNAEILSSFPQTTLAKGAKKIPKPKPGVAPDTSGTSGIPNDGYFSDISKV